MEERAYLDAPRGDDELRDRQGRLGRQPGEWLRTGEDAWKQAGLGSDAADAAVREAIAAQPILLERPIVVRGSRAAVGRPPEQILELLD